jgi:hypothetical protein
MPRIRRWVGSFAGGRAGILRAATVGALATAAMLPAAARADRSQAACIASWRDTVSPGVSLTPAFVTFTSDGERGSISCAGTVDGHLVTGIGTFGEAGQAQGTCLSGSGSTTFSMTIPTTAGPVHLQMPGVFTLLGGVGFRPTGDFPGGFVFVPLDGTCALLPVTELQVVLHGTLLT